jgi:surface polysaccharide O-acyltransferase-like enzyme
MHSYNLQKIYGFDYLRAICGIAVVCLHTNIPSLVLKFKNFHNIIVDNGFYLAVPVFFKIALVLFFLNRQKNKDYFFQKKSLYDVTLNFATPAP